MKALALLSGGLDSSLAVKMILDQGIEVVGVKFTSPFCKCDSGGKCHAAEISDKLGIELMTVQKGEEYLEVVRNPRFGRGSGMNPCIDCRIFMLKKAKEIADRIGARFMITGEVVGQRPMSQKKDTMRLIEKEAGLKGKILRPLSAKILPPTEAETEGWVDRELLQAISGRSRKEQINLASKNEITDYPCPAGGCLLTDKDFSSKLRDFIENNRGKISMRDILLLQTGRHFRIGSCKLIVGRDEGENSRLKNLRTDNQWLLEPIGIPGPVGLADESDSFSRDLASSIVARYSDNEDSEVEIRCISPRDESDSVVRILPAKQEHIEELRISGGN